MKKERTPKESIASKILKKLLAGETLTSKSVITEFHYANLSKEISRLRKKGHKITTMPVNVDGEYKFGYRYVFDDSETPVKPNKMGKNGMYIVLGYLQQHGSITTSQIIKLTNIRPTHIIYELRRCNYNIETLRNGRQFIYKLIRD